MDAAWHMTKSFQNDFPDGLIQELTSIYGESHVPDPYLEELLSSLSRLYVGDEFCITRMPEPDELSRFIRFADKNKLSLSLLTPVLTDQGIDRCTPLFDRLKQWNPAADIVVNDLGVLFFLKKRYPGFRFSMGRLFNKGFKDPRLVDKDLEVSGKTTGFLTDCSFKQKNIQILAEGLGIDGLEQDLLPYADLDDVGMSTLKTAVYFPFGYVTTGRVCFAAGLDPNPGKRFSLAGCCSSPCVAHCLELKHSSLAFKLFQKGNTIFYMYPLPLLRALLEKARQQELRLVFQGGIL